MKALSLFANIGIAEAYLQSIGIDVVIANELISKRAELYQKIYPHTHMICGDITNYKVFENIISESKKQKIDIIMAMPPCQEIIKTNKQQKDVKESLIIPVIDLTLKLMPSYVFIENAPSLLSSSIIFENKNISINDLLREVLGDKYNINMYQIDTKDYSVPQTKERAIILMSRKDQEKVWTLPNKDEKIITLREAIGDIPILDPYIRDINRSELLEHFPNYEKRRKAALKISKLHFPPSHLLSEVTAMEYTPEGCTAFGNSKYKPIKTNGEHGKIYKNTYKRQRWDEPAYTIPVDNIKISSQNNVHPGRFIGKNLNGDNIYSDPRAFTIYELMLISTLPIDWPIPNNTSKSFLRTLISEGMPPLFIKKVFKSLLK